jgi:NAD(P)-dependent dehydrogenase (short-subunit alcohol dehydrogenase family)
VPTVLVFGVRNLGRAIALERAGQGWDVAGMAQSEDSVQAFRDAVPGALGLVGDAIRSEDVERTFAETVERFGSVDLVVDAITARPRGSFGGGALADAAEDDLEPYAGELLTGVFNIVRIAARVLGEQGSGTLVQITGGSARRGMVGRGPWAAAAFATRALLQSAALELRERGVHAALLVVDASIESPKTAALLEGRPQEASTTEEDVAAAVAYLAAQSPRGWTHELQITPSGDRWVP